MGVVVAVAVAVEVLDGVNVSSSILHSFTVNVESNTDTTVSTVLTQAVKATCTTQIRKYKYLVCPHSQAKQWREVMGEGALNQRHPGPTRRLATGYT